MADESPKERVNRELIEMLNELRVALPGVQVLFAFLLTLPFTAGWDRISDTDRDVYYAAVLFTALSIALMIAPSAHHRMRFRAEVKESMLKVTSKLAIIGLGLLAAGVAATLYLITDVVYGSDLAAAVAAVFALGVFTLWFVVPFAYRER
jgi:uncharacterized membrane protein YiaA